MSARLFLFACYFHFNPNNVFVMNKSASDKPQSMSEIIDECLSASFTLNESTLGCVSAAHYEIKIAQLTLLIADLILM